MMIWDYIKNIDPDFWKNYIVPFLGPVGGVIVALLIFILTLWKEWWNRKRDLKEIYHYFADSLESMNKLIKNQSEGLIQYVKAQRKEWIAEPVEVVAYSNWLKSIDVIKFRISFFKFFKGTKEEKTTFYNEVSAYTNLFNDCMKSLIDSVDEMRTKGNLIAYKVADTMNDLKKFAMDFQYIDEKDRSDFQKSIIKEYLLNVLSPDPHKTKLDSHYFQQAGKLAMTHMNKELMDLVGKHQIILNQKAAEEEKHYQFLENLSVRFEEGLKILNPILDRVQKHLP